MRYKAYGYKLPKKIAVGLFGDRRKFGRKPDENSQSWKEWKQKYLSFYEETQKNGIGNIINNAGYKILQSVNMEGLKVLEVGPGGLYHLECWNGDPSLYVLIDIDANFLRMASKKLTRKNIPNEMRLSYRENSGILPACDNEFDLIIAFYSFEHLYPFETYLQEFMRVLKPEGRIVGAIPAEGGIAWGGGRFLTSRRWLKRNTNINPNKIICWEHPTMADEILNTMSEKMKCEIVQFWPLGIATIDLNLLIKFVLKNKCH